MPIINADATTDPNKILPLKYPWAWEIYKAGVKNNWTPDEVGMQADIEQWKSNKVLNDIERRIVLWNLGFFSTAESLTGNNIILAIYKHLAVPEIRMALGRQNFEECIHTETMVYCCDSLGLDPNEIYTMYQNIPSIKAKDDFVVDLTKSIFKDDFKLDSTANIQAFLKDLIGFYVIMEGIYFYAGFAMLLAMKNQHKMVGIGEQIQFTLRDESLHLLLGNHIIQTIIDENPDVWTQDFQEEIVSLIKKAVDLEGLYVDDCCPQGVLGIQPNLFKQYVRHIADRRIERLGLKPVYGDENPFLWMSQQMDLPVENNFFETRVKEYQTSSLEW